MAEPAHKEAAKEAPAHKAEPGIRAPTLDQRHPLGQGDVIDRLVALEARMTVIQAIVTPPPAPEPAPPTVVDAPYVAQTNDLLQCTMGNWNGMYDEPHSYAYQWRRDGTHVGTAANSYAVTANDVGKSLDCVVTATNSLGSATSTSNAVIVTQPTATATATATKTATTPAPAPPAQASKK